MDGMEGAGLIQGLRFLYCGPIQLNKLRGTVARGFEFTPTLPTTLAVVLLHLGLGSD